MSNTLLPCPFCGKCAHTGHYRSRHKDDEHYLVMCDYCFARTVGSTPEEAIAAWNRRAQPESTPLTLDELRQMDGEPVYIAEEKLWVIIKCEQTGRWAGMPFAVGQTHGINFEWNIKKRGLKCYRYKPKEEHNETD